MATIAITVIGHNESQLLPRVFASVSWAQELIYVDCESRDESLEVARRYTDRVFTYPNDKGMTDKRSFSFRHVTADWIFYLDPDEVISPELAQEIQETIASDPPENGYRLPRKNYYFGRWLKHGRQYPDTQLRLFRRGKAYFPERIVHERLQVDGAIGRLKQDLEHHTAESPGAAIEKMNYYSSIYALIRLQEGQRPTAWQALVQLVFRPAGLFFRRYVIKRGFLDGLPGFMIACISSFELPMVYFKMWYWSRYPEKMPKIGDPGAKG